MANKDYYKILGVTRDASEDEIKKAFRKLAHVHHPDKKGGNAEKFKEINEANQILSDKTKRQQFDQFGSDFAQGNHGAPGGGSPFGGGQHAGGFEFNFGNAEDLGDLFGGFGDMFGFGGGRSGGGRAKTQRGEDIAIDVELTLEESSFGVERTLKLNKLASCETCSGSGAASNSKTVGCKECGGKGQIVRMQQTILGAMQTVATCPHCHGSGKIPEKPCGTCSGTGVRKREQTITVKIPAGIHQGESIRLTGHGAAAAYGAPAGDLYIRIHVRPHKTMQRDGDNIHTEVHISYPTAVLGGIAETDSLEGRITIKIPEGIVSGEQVRLKGKGGVRHGGGRGDHFVHVTIAVPKHISRAGKKLLEQLQEELKQS